MPPEGNDEASGSPRTSSLPLNSAMALPSPVGARKLSCFSAVRPVIGWNMWVKWVAPFSMAQSFMAVATASAMAGSSASPPARVTCSLAKTSSGRRSRCTAMEKTLAPKASFSGWVRSSAPSDSPLELHCAAVTFCWRIRVIAWLVLTWQSAPK